MPDLPKNRTADADQSEPANPAEEPTDSLDENVQDGAEDAAQSAEETAEEYADDEGPTLEPAEEKDPGIQDTLEVLEAVSASYGAILELTEGDVVAGARELFTTFDEYRDAWEDIEDVPDEVGDLDADELEQLAEAGLDIAKHFVPNR